MKVLRLSGVDADKAFANFLGHNQFLGLVFIAQIIVAIWSATFYEGVITIGVASLYILMWTGMLVVFGINHKKDMTEQTQPSSIAPQSWMTMTFRYTLFLIIGLAVFMALMSVGLLNGGSVYKPYALSIFIFQVFIVAPSETIAFQGVLPNRMRSWIKKQNSKLLKRGETFVVYTTTQSVFAIAHYSAYGGNWGHIFTAWIFGMIFLFFAETWGLSACMGFHSSFNLAISGVIGGIANFTIIQNYSPILLAIIVASAVCIVAIKTRAFTSFRVSKLTKGAYVNG